MRRATKLALGLAGLIGIAGTSPAQASLYLEETDARTRMLVVDPFSRQAMSTLARINQAGDHIAGGGTPVLSIDNVIERQTFEHPEYGTSFWVHRTITFDLSQTMARVDAALEPYRKDGCSKFKISSPSLLSLEPHRIRLRINMSFKKRACDNFFGTHDLAKGHGSAVIVGRLTSAAGSPQLSFEAEDIDIDTDSVLGIDPNSMFGRIVRILTVDLARLLGSLNPVRGSIGELQFRLLRPITRLAETETISAAQARYSASEIDQMVRGYGSLSLILRNPDAEPLQFTLADSGMAWRREYRLRPEFAGQKPTKLCNELGSEGLRDYYCVATGESKMVLRIVQTMWRANDSRPVLESHYRREAVYLSSLSDDTDIKFYPSHTQEARIVDEVYVDQLFKAFFRKNNPEVRCSRDFSPGRPVSTGQSFCGYRIVPAWQRILKPNPAIAVDESAPLGREEFGTDAQCGPARAAVDSRCRSDSARGGI